MSDPFKNLLAPKEKKDGKYPWTFNAPTKDQAHSGNLPAGDYYGVGFRTPVGKEKPSPMSAGPIPQKSKCINPKDMIDREPK